MAISVNSLIQQAFEECSLVGDGQSVSGTKAQVGLSLLNVCIAELNAQNYIITAFTRKDVNFGETCIIAPSATATINAEPPDTIQFCLRKLGQRYIRLTKTGQSVLDGKVKQGLSQMFNYETYLDPDTGLFTGRITTDSRASFDYRLYYNTKIPACELGGNLYLPEIYYGLLLAALAQRLAIRYNVDGSIQKFTSLLKAQKTLAKRNNSTNRPITYGDGIGSYVDQYYQGYTMGY